MKKFLTAAFAFLLPAIAFAQEAVTQVTTTIDITPLLLAAVPFVILLFAAGINWLLKKAKVDKLVGQQKIQEMLDKVMEQAAAYAVSNLKNANWTKIETKHEALGFAANYAIEHGDDLIKAAGLDTNKLYEKLEAKLLPHDTAPGQWTETPAADTVTGA